MHSLASECCATISCDNHKQLQWTQHTPCNLIENNIYKVQLNKNSFNTNKSIIVLVSYRAYYKVGIYKWLCPGSAVKKERRQRPIIIALYCLPIKGNVMETYSTGMRCLMTN